jgi:hypothetical protein
VAKRSALGNQNTFKVLEIDTGTKFERWYTGKQMKNQGIGALGNQNTSEVYEVAESDR